MIKKAKSVLKGVLGLAGISLVDPIEVYYLPQENTFYPIISKSGCSSIKLILIRKFKPEYANVFPGIHKIDPFKITDGNLERLYFKTETAYGNWARGKNMVFIMREPLSRFYSCYLDVIRNKNTMYLYPSGLNWYFNYNTDLTFDEFLKKVCSTSDVLSDRHFRSQTFYLSETVERNLKSLEAYSLKDFMRKSSGDEGSNDKESIMLNSNKSSLPEELRAKLTQSKEFNERFMADLKLFNSIKSDK